MKGQLNFLWYIRDGYNFGWHSENFLLTLRGGAGSSVSSDDRVPLSGGARALGSPDKHGVILAAFSQATALTAGPQLPDMKNYHNG